MTPVVTRDQADLLLRYGVGPVAWMLVDPEEGIPHARSSMACGGGASAAWQYETTARGIVGSRAFSVPVREDVVVSWRLIRQAADHLPALLREDLRAARARTQREWLRYFPEFVPWMPGGRAPWVEPPPSWHREAQAAELAALVACLDSLTGERSDVPGQLELFGVAA
ncbi:hypothetical protein [Blastococcus xanthinilyticus]|uniref:Uncharacterized protein n=1 Tax=Blastococcus xanthinilyticus TaxID=1564164 RepID=A0A5S5CQV2_9ACTN|nr:hypothetical protein [Blastococcus xanthinilyticus]TYP82036.1 hypothetical protein BD833_12020 [Blastococcus xanthinilyticus]